MGELTELFFLRAKTNGRLSVLDRVTDPAMLVDMNMGVRIGYGNYLSMKKEVENCTDGLDNMLVRLPRNQEIIDEICCTQGGACEYIISNIFIGMMDPDRLDRYQEDKEVARDDKYMYIKDDNRILRFKRKVVENY